MKKYKIRVKGGYPIETDATVSVVNVDNSLIEIQLNGKTKATINKSEFISCLEV